jgi:RNA polymerase sigma-70 factor (ECF subfamily)
MFVYATRFIDDPEIVKDILQELFLDFWNRKEKLHIELSLSAFLFKMLHNRCIDYLRTQASKERSETQYHALGLEEDPFSAIFMNEIHEIVEKTMDKLPPQTRQIFRMSRNKGMTNNEIAEKMSLSVRTVEKHIYQTLKTLKKQLADYK